MSEEREQFKLTTPPTLLVDLETQRQTLGFNSANELAVVYLTSLSKVPADRVFEALALVRKYHKAERSTRKGP